MRATGASTELWRGISHERSQTAASRRAQRVETRWHRRSPLRGALMARHLLLRAAPRVV